MILIAFSRDNQRALDLSRGVRNMARVKHGLLVVDANLASIHMTARTRASYIRLMARYAKAVMFVEMSPVSIPTYSGQFPANLSPSILPNWVRQTPSPYTMIVDSPDMTPDRIVEAINSRRNK